MIAQTLSMMASMYEAVGPGFFLVAALPLSLAGLVLVVRASLQRARRTD